MKLAEITRIDRTLPRDRLVLERLDPSDFWYPQALASRNAHCTFTRPYLQRRMVELDAHLERHPDDKYAALEMQAARDLYVKRYVRPVTARKLAANPPARRRRRSPLGGTVRETVPLAVAVASAVVGGTLLWLGLR